MSESYIGWWEMRAPNGRWHLVESEVADRVVTRCGRQMRLNHYQVALAFELNPSGVRCSICTGRMVPA